MNNTVTAWEMLRDIKRGEVWEITEVPVTGNWYGVRVVKDDSVEALKFAMPCVGKSKGDLVPLCGRFLEGKWRKVRMPVAFSEAFAAYEDGKLIISAVSGVGFVRSMSTLNFPESAIRGKWYIED